MFYIILTLHFLIHPNHPSLQRPEEWSLRVNGTNRAQLVIIVITRKYN